MLGSGLLHEPIGDISVILRIPTIATTRSDGSRPPIPTDRDHLFRSIATSVKAPLGTSADLSVLL